MPLDGRQNIPLSSLVVLSPCDTTAEAFQSDQRAIEFYGNVQKRDQCLHSDQDTRDQIAFLVRAPGFAFLVRPPGSYE